MFIKIKNKKGFTLIELAVVIIIIGILATIGVPKFKNSVEKSRATEAFTYGSAVLAAQEQYHIANGTYAADIASLGVFSDLKNFDAALSGISDTAYTLTITRNGGADPLNYTVIFNEVGYNGGTIPDKWNPQA